MKYLLTLSTFCLVSFNLFTQDLSKSDLLTIYRTADKIRYEIEQFQDIKDASSMPDQGPIDQLLRLIADSSYKSGAFKLSTHMYYNPANDRYVCSIICAEWIETDSDWGLNNYLFILELDLTYNQDTREVQIVGNRLLEQNSNLKSWWQSFMDTYRNPKYRRNYWGKELGFIPPPPPPPQTTEWFKKQ